MSQIPFIDKEAEDEDEEYAYGCFVDADDRAQRCRYQRRACPPRAVSLAQPPPPQRPCGGDRMLQCQISRVHHELRNLGVADGRRHHQGDNWAAYVAVLRAALQRAAPYADDDDPGLSAEWGKGPGGSTTALSTLTRSSPKSPNVSRGRNGGAGGSSFSSSAASPSSSKRRRRR